MYATSRFYLGITCNCSEIFDLHDGHKDVPAIGAFHEEADVVVADVLVVGLALEEPFVARVSVGVVVQCKPVADDTD